MTLSSLSPEHITPAANVFLARVAPDAVLLDVATDAYFCLADADALITSVAEGGLRAVTAAVRDELLETGLFVAGGRPQPSFPLPPRPRRSTRSDDPRRGTWRERSDFALTMVHTARRFPGRSIRDLATSAVVQRPPLGDADRLIRRSVLFDQWLPWMPGQGQCLYRAFALLDFLRRDGLTAHWVFGVRTWSFSAHCWLQCDDLLLDDDLDRVGLYTPLMAI